MATWMGHLRVAEIRGDLGGQANLVKPTSEVSSTSG